MQTYVDSLQTLICGVWFAGSGLLSTPGVVRGPVRGSFQATGRFLVSADYTLIKTIINIIFCSCLLDPHKS